jgi:hypothetical protein
MAPPDYSELFSIRGKTALVTGASSGIGSRFSVTWPHRVPMWWWQLAGKKSWKILSRFVQKSWLLIRKLVS